MISQGGIFTLGLNNIELKSANLYVWIYSFRSPHETAEKNPVFYMTPLKISGHRTSSLSCLLSFINSPNSLILGRNPCPSLSYSPSLLVLLSTYMHFRMWHPEWQSAQDSFCNYHLLCSGNSTSINEVYTEWDFWQLIPKSFLYES